LDKPEAEKIQSALRSIKATSDAYSIWVKTS
jgi:hypothetical protein